VLHDPRLNLQFNPAAPAGTPIRWHFLNIFWPPDLRLPEVADHRLAAVPFANSDRTEPLAVIYRKKKQLTPAMNNFINALKQPVPPAN
jgi:DNA-binding transcriptional LysR family regulator